VWFRPYPKNHEQYQVAWPEKGVQNGWLVLDRNGNGIIDDFSELFGNETPQPKPKPGQKKNGFAALAFYDELEQGGNGDGWVSKEDKIFSKLRVWVDANHDGISQPSELLTLDQAGVAAISLDYHLSKVTDTNGNVFRYRAKVRDTQAGETSKIIYDVYVDIGAPRAQNTNSSKKSEQEWPPRTVSSGFVHVQSVQGLPKVQLLTQ
jgi:hypothetical protein